MGMYSLLPFHMVVLEGKGPPAHRVPLIHDSPFHYDDDDDYFLLESEGFHLDLGELLQGPSPAQFQTGIHLPRARMCLGEISRHMTGRGSSQKRPQLKKEQSAPDEKERFQTISNWYSPSDAKGHCISKKGTIGD